jgi:hypothetical protein
MKLPKKFPALLCCLLWACAPARVKSPEAGGPVGVGGTGGFNVPGINAPRPGPGGTGGAGGQRLDAGMASPDRPVTPPVVIRMDAAFRPVADRPPPTDVPPREVVLYVTGSGENGDLATDEVMVDLVRDLGYRVNVETDADVQADDIAEAVAVVFSASTDSATLIMTLPQAPMLDKPIVAMDENLEPFLGYTGMAPGDLGTTTETQVAIIEGADPTLTAGLSGTVTVYSTDFGIQWGNPGPGALRVATVGGNENQVALYAYPKGAMMANGTPAPAKRVFFFARENADEDLVTADGLKLFDAAFKFATAP